MHMDEWRRSLQTMGLPCDAALDEIQASYRRLVRRYHPDVNHSPEAVRCFREIVEAYDTASALARLKQVARSPDILHAARAHSLIGRIDSARLRRWLRLCPSADVRAAALAALVVRQEPPSARVLEAVRQDPAARVRALAQQLSAGLDGPPPGLSFRQGLRSALQLLRRKGYASRCAADGAMN